LLCCSQNSNIPLIATQKETNQRGQRKMGFNATFDELCNGKQTLGCFTACCTPFTFKLLCLSFCHRFLMDKAY